MRDTCKVHREDLGRRAGVTSRERPSGVSERVEGLRAEAARYLKAAKATANRGARRQLARKALALVQEAEALGAVRDVLRRWRKL
jgi:hypothetical protein